MNQICIQVVEDGGELACSGRSASTGGIALGGCFLVRISRTII